MLQYAEWLTNNVCGWISPKTCDTHSVAVAGVISEQWINYLVGLVPQHVTHTQGGCCSCLHCNWGLHIQDSGTISSQSSALKTLLYACDGGTLSGPRRTVRPARTWEQNHGLWRWNTSRSLQDCQTTRIWEQNHGLLIQQWGRRSATLWRTSSVQRLTSELLEVLSEWKMKKNGMIYQYCLAGLTPSLPWCHLKTTIKSVKFETLQPFCFLFHTGMWKDFHQNA